MLLAVPLEQPLHGPLQLGLGRRFQHQDRQAKLLGLPAHMGITAELMAQAEHRIGQLHAAHHLHSQLAGPPDLLQQAAADSHPVQAQQGRRSRGGAGRGWLDANRGDGGRLGPTQGSGSQAGGSRWG